MREITLAIDFGTARTKVAYFDETHGKPSLVEMGRKDRNILPSVFYVPKGEGDVRVGDDAVDLGWDDPEGMIVGLKTELAKMGKKRLGGGRRAVERVELASCLFGYIREFCAEQVFHQHDIHTARVTVPAEFTEPRRESIREAALKGGFRNVSLIDEPVAAARAWLAVAGQELGDVIIVCDVGGGTTDFALLGHSDGEFYSDDRVPPAGIEKGGNDVDQLLFELLVDRHPDLEDELGRAKSLCLLELRRTRELMNLDERDSFSLRIGGRSLEVPREILTEASGEFVETVVAETARFIKRCHEAGATSAPLLLVGGGSRTFGLEAELRRVHAGKVFNWNQADYAVVLGAVEMRRDYNAKTKDTATTSPGRSEFECDLESFRQWSVPDEFLRTRSRDRVDKWVEAAEHGDPAACSLVANCFLCGVHLPLNSAAALPYLRNAVKGGSTRAKMDLGFFIAATGESATRRAEGVTMLVEAARTIPSAAASLAIISQHLADDEADRSNVIQTLIDASKTGDREANGTLAQFLKDGIGMPVDRNAAIRHANLAASAGDVGSMLLLGEWLLETGANDQDTRQAVEWFRRAAEAGHSVGQLRLAQCLREGVGVPKRIEEAVVWLNQSVERDNVHAIFELAVMYQCGEGVSRNCSKAVQLLKRAASGGHALSCLALGNAFLEGNGIAANPDAAVEWYQKGADLGDSDCKAQVAVALMLGLGIRQDQQAAIKLFREAEQEGSRDGIFGLGQCYAEGHGTPRDLRKAEEYFTRLASQGDAEACFKLGQVVESQQQSACAHQWYERGAEAGHGYCMAKLGQFRLDQHDFEGALKWFEKSANTGCSDGEKFLGFYKIHGIGCPTDSQRGISLLNSAIEKNDAEAMMILGQYWAERGSKDEARRLFTRAREHGFPDADTALKKLESGGWMKAAAGIGGFILGALLGGE